MNIDGEPRNQPVETTSKVSPVPGLSLCGSKSDPGLIVGLQQQVLLQSDSAHVYPSWAQVLPSSPGQEASRDVDFRVRSPALHLVQSPRIPQMIERTTPPQKRRASLSPTTLRGRAGSVLASVLAASEGDRSASFLAWENSAAPHGGSKARSDRAVTGGPHFLSQTQSSLSKIKEPVTARVIVTPCRHTTNDADQQHTARQQTSSENRRTTRRKRSLRPSGRAIFLRRTTPGARPVQQTAVPPSAGTNMVSAPPGLSMNPTISSDEDSDNVVLHSPVSSEESSNVQVHSHVSSTTDPSNIVLHDSHRSSQESPRPLAPLPTTTTPKPSPMVAAPRAPREAAALEISLIKNVEEEDATPGGGVLGLNVSTTVEPWTPRADTAINNSFDMKTSSGQAPSEGSCGLGGSAMVLGGGICCEEAPLIKACNAALEKGQALGKPFVTPAPHVVAGSAPPPLSPRRKLTTDEIFSSQTSQEGDGGGGAKCTPKKRARKRRTYATDWSPQRPQRLVMSAGSKRPAEKNTSLCQSVSPDEKTGVTITPASAEKVDLLASSTFSDGSFVFDQTPSLDACVGAVRPIQLSDSLQEGTGFAEGTVPSRKDLESTVWTCQINAKPSVRERGADEEQHGDPIGQPLASEKRGRCMEKDGAQRLGRAVCIVGWWHFHF